MTAPSRKHFTRGGQIAFHNLRMLFQINKALFNLHCVSWLVIFGGLVWYAMPQEILIQVMDYEMASTLKWVGQEHVFNVPYSGGPLNNRYMHYKRRTIIQKWRHAVFID